MATFLFIRKVHFFYKILCTDKSLCSIMDLSRGGISGKTIYESIKLDIEKIITTLPKLKEIEIRGHRKLKNIRGRIINATIYKETNKYYVSLCIEEQTIKPKLIPTSIVGIDVGIKTLVTSSNGKIYKTPKQIKKYLEIIKG